MDHHRSVACRGGRAYHRHHITLVLRMFGEEKESDAGIVQPQPAGDDRLVRRDGQRPQNASGGATHMRERRTHGQIFWNRTHISAFHLR